MTFTLQIRFLGDPTAQFNEALDLTFDSTAIFGNHRSKRYALLVEDGKVKEAFVEPDNAGLNGMCSFPLFSPTLSKLIWANSFGR